MSYGRLAPSVTFDRYEAQLTLRRLRRYDGKVLRGFHDKIFRAWQLRGANYLITVPLTQRELEVMRRLGASSRPQVIRFKWFAIYVNGPTEVYTRTTRKPPKHKTLRVAGKGRQKFQLQHLYRLPLNSKESTEFMARKRAATKKSTVEVEDEIDELEGLEELEDEDVEEPEVEEDEDDEEEVKPKRRTRAKKAAAKSTRKKRTTVEDDEDEDEEDEEEDEPAPKKRTRKKGASAKSAKSNGKGSKSAAGRTTAEMTGGVGTAELAEAASEVADIEITGRDVRVYLRKNEVEKNEEHGRYYWKSTGSPQFKKLAKAIAAEYAEE